MKSTREHLVYESVKPGSGGSVSLMLTPLELIDRLAALIPPPRRHRHRYFGVLAPNAPLRSAVTALAGPQAETPAAHTPAAAPAAPPPAPAGASAETAQAAEEPIHRRAARYAWALLLARIYEVFPLLCPKCGGEMRIIAFINEAIAVREILAHLGEPTSPPPLAPARRPPLWEMADAAARTSSTRRPNRRRTTNSISASPGSSTRIRSRSSGSARAVGHRDGLGGRLGDPRHDLRCDSGAVFRLHRMQFLRDDC